MYGDFSKYNLKTKEYDYAIHHKPVPEPPTPAFEMPYDYEAPGQNYYVLDKEIKDFQNSQSRNIKSPPKPYWSLRENKGPQFSNILSKIRKEEPKRHLEILLTKYGKLKEEEEALKNVQEVQNIYSNHDRKQSSSTGQKGHKRRGYYAPTNPYEDLNDLIKSIKRTREQNAETGLDEPI